MNYFILFSLFILFSPTLQAQSAEDPLADSYTIHNGGGDELITLDGGYYSSPLEISIFKMYKAFELYPQDTLLKVLSWNAESPGNFSDIALSDFDKNELQEIVAVWDNDRQVEIVLLKADPARLTVDSTNAWDSVERITKSNPAIFESAGWGLLSGVFVKTGNFDSDSLGEFVVAYLADDGKVEITAYDVTDSLTITELGTIRDQEIAVPEKINLCEDQVYLFDIECADFNGDGIDEILLSGRSAYQPAGWQIFAKVYSYNEVEKKLEAKAKETLFIQTDPNRDIGNFNTASGNLFSTDIEHAVVGFFQYDPHVYSSDIEADTIANILIPIEIDEQLSNIIVGETVYQRQDTIARKCYYGRTSTLRTVDVNNDGMDELLSAFSFSRIFPIFKIYKGSPTLNLSTYADLDNLADEFHTSITFGDFYLEDQQEEKSIEIIVQVPNYDYESKMYQILTHEDGSFDRLELKYSGSYLPQSKTEPLLAGNLDGDIRLGQPKRYSVTDILQPLVILNAPPVHFDVFDDEIYDVCKSYNENDGSFVASYVKETQQSTEVQTEINRDWSMSTTLSGGFSFWGLSVSSHLTQTYGKKFSKVEGSSRTVSVGFEVDATVDDQIYATVMNYDLWEYPVYGDNQLQGHILVVDPQIVTNSWFDSKSWKGYSYIPNHEVGNILSYRRYPLLADNPMLIEKVKGDYGFDTSFLLSGNSSYDWYLNFQDFTESQSTTTKEYTRDWGVSVSYWGAGFSIDGSYHSEDIQTQRTTVENGIYLDVHLDAVDMSIGETRYDVTPYAYWANNGALIIDYAVAPELAAQGGEDTWWDAHYGYLPDPAFILPWRYDPEKGDAVSEAKRFQTKDILFHPTDPAVGDVITILARVHNFSLLPTPGPVSVSFYIGDPDSGGIQIIDEGGSSEVFTDGLIPPRGTAEVQMQWKVLGGIGAYPRIYAMIDAEKNITEIHENNNKSWNILQKSTITGIQNPDREFVPKDFSLKQNYPNPFNPITKTKYSLPKAETVIIEVFNMLGKHVQTLINKKMPQGEHEISFDGRLMSSGIYFYKMKAGNFEQTKKMLLLK